MSEQGRPHFDGNDAEVPILVQPALGARDGPGDGLPRAPEWPDKAFPSSAPPPFEQGAPHPPPGQLHSVGHLVPQMPVPGPGTAAAAKSAAGRLTRAQQSELEMARRRAQKAAQGKAARRVKRRASDSDQGGSDDELQQKLSTVTDEKEAKRLKRLLRNRVSAQQARERKKSYVATLEEKARAQEQRLAEAEQRIKTLERENVMLRSVMKNMQGGGGGLGGGLGGLQGDDEAAPDHHIEAAVPVISSFPRSAF